ncbi:hypothetical protein I6E18_11985 [Phocaeicola barnesiae]|uniref:hypothetical protein n=1 Tax=Phocaeicola barnesiae TaxID=376804 RepID=UPI001F182D93|nr:hypothetical protein [Phocaeicola barnesiae]MCF2576866.1 hypothetical protein [Phocaeicola barnesiae]
MKKELFYILLLLLFSMTTTAQTTQTDFDYHLDWGGDRIHVTLHYTLPNPGDTILHYGNLDYGGQTDIFGCIKNLRAKGADITADSIHRTVTLHNIQEKEICLTYDIVSRLPNKGLNCPMEMFRPNISENFIYCHGINLFLRLPDNETKSYTQRVSWGKRPAFPVFSLYHAGNSYATVSRMAKDFQNTIIVGDKELFVDTLLIGGIPNYVVTAPRKNIDYNRSAIAEYFKKFYTGIIRFWEEEHPSPYSLIVYPFEKIPFEASGIGLDHGFCARYNPKADTILTDNRIDLFSHEIGHNWISADMDNQWFGEGFNELQTMYMVVATGLKPIDSFVDYLNKSLASLHHSPARNLPNDSIRIRFWELGDYSWIPYWRGAVYAFRLLGQIEHATGNPHSFKALMMAFKGQTTSMNREKFLTVTSQFLDRELLEEEFEQYIMRAETIKLDTNRLMSGCALRYKEDGTPYIIITDYTAFKKHFVL